MLTNVCIYDCAYCINRRSNDIPRCRPVTPGELAELTIEFYRRNYIEGLFLSSGVVRDPDYTMERMVRVARDLRTRAPFQRVHPSEEHSRCQPRTGGRGRTLRRPHERQHRNPDRTQPAIVGSRQELRKHLPPDELHPAGGAPERRGAYALPPCAPLRSCRAEHADDRRGHGRERPRHSCCSRRPSTDGPR